MHGYPFTRPHLRPIDHAMIRGHEAAAHRGTLKKPHLLRHRHEVKVGIRDADITAVTAPIGETGDSGIGTDVGLSTAAVFTNPITLTERHQHAVALFEVVHLFADFFDDAAKLMAHNERHSRR